MKINPRNSICITLLIALVASLTLLSTRMRADTGTCGGASITLPFTDVPAGNVFFCSIAEAFFSGLTNGTTATTYSPSANVPREQMAAFVTRTLDQSLQRGSRRVALDKLWTPTSTGGLALTTVGSFSSSVKSDGADLWVASFGDGTVSRVRASDGKLLETWTGAASASAVLSAAGMIFVTGEGNPGKLYQIDPTQPAGAVTTLGVNLGATPKGISFDGSRIWTANFGGSVSILHINPVSAATTVTAGFSNPIAILYDGANMWVIDYGPIPGKLFKLNSSGAIIQTVTVGNGPFSAVFDGTNIWVANTDSDTISVVRASTGTVVATLTGNGLNGPYSAAFDGERILVTNYDGNNVALWKAADLTPLGFVITGANTNPSAVCSDGLNFWFALGGAVGKLARF